MSRARVICTGMLLAMLPLMIASCQLGIGAQPAPTPIPPATPLPPAAPEPGTQRPNIPLSGASRMTERDTKVIDGYLHVRYLPPCERVPRPAEWVAPIILTDIRYGSILHLNSDGAVMTSPEPQYASEEAKAALEAVLQDDSVVKQIVARPHCPYRN